MCFVEDPAAGSQQVEEPPFPDQLLSRVRGQGQKGLVHFQDDAVGVRGQVSARGVLVQIRQVVLQECGVDAG